MHSIDDRKNQIYACLHRLLYEMRLYLNCIMCLINEEEKENVYDID
jgi:hypothetical protein